MTLTYDSIVDLARTDAQRRLVSTHRDGAHAIVTLDDPEKLNPLSALRAGRGRSSQRTAVGRP